MLGRILVLGAFLAGVAAFFLPFLNVNAVVIADGQTETDNVSFSVMQIFQGASAFENLSGGVELTEGQKKEINSTLDTIRGVLLIPFAPTALFLLILLASIKRFGRGHGIFALIVGLVAAAGWGLLTAAATDQASSGAGFGIGLTLVLVGGILGTIGGIAGIAKPQRKLA